MNIDINDSFLLEILDQIERNHLADPDDRWLLAVSGGPDSMAMLTALTELKNSARLPLADLQLAHLNHQLRADQSDADETFIRQQAKNSHLPITVARCDVQALAQNTSQSLETAARQARYDFLAQTARKNYCNKIALAHNADDQAETILHRIIRGTGIKGLAGITPIRDLDDDQSVKPLQIVRPLLTVSRDQIEQFLRRRNIPWRIDASNESNTFTRNRIRNQLLPLLAEQYNPQVKQALIRLGQTAHWLTDLLSRNADATLQNLTLQFDSNSAILDAASLAQLPPIQQTELIRHLLEKLKLPLQRISFLHIRSVTDLLNHPDQFSKLQLPENLQVALKNQELHFSIVTDQQDSQKTTPLTQIILISPGTNDLPAKYLFVDNQQSQPAHSLRIENLLLDQYNQLNPAEFYRAKSHRQEIIDPDKIVGQLTLRTWQNGDRFQPLGSAGSKTLGDFFTDHNIPTESRPQIGLLCDDRGIIWTLGLRIADRVKITHKTSQLLKLSLA
ncbi:MAG: tRNA lysidine(34) synthetase TilS [Sedimentisphaerales bacterium]|nr:tRNA lysidine(34) synthetase TilS [Sedimentisphaerales bacterium]